MQEPIFIFRSYHILSYHILSYPFLSYRILSYPILSYPILSYPITYFLTFTYEHLLHGIKTPSVGYQKEPTA